MISPSKVQQHKQPTRDNSDIHSHVRLQKGRKPLERKSFYLDIKNHALAANLEAKIKDLGGVTELFLVKSVTLVVSDRADKLGQNNCDKKKWGYGSGGSGGPPSLRSIEVPTPIATPPTPFGGEYPLSNSTNIRGQTAQRTKSRADAMLERALTQPQQCSVDPLNNAQSWGIPIWATKKLQAWLEKIYESLKDTGNLKRAADNSATEKTLKVKHLKNSYIKFESFKRDTRPVFLELPLWPKLNFDGDPGTCPFDPRIREKKVCKVEESASLNKEKGKEMTRRPRATATRARRTEQLVAGHCEICRIDYRDLSKHVQSDKHIAFVRNDDNFLSLDKLINSGASVEAFLRANEVGQDCNLFPDGDRSVRSVEDEVKVKKGSKTDLTTYGVEEIKMVQCNGGARRNLNLKLSSPHNLRTRAKHESGHLLRSKGSPWHEGLQQQDNKDNNKFYDKYEGFTIKKRAKGTIWIEEDEIPAVDKCSRLDGIVEMAVDERSSEPKPRIAEEPSYPCKPDVEAEPIKPADQPSQRKNDCLEDRVLPKLERNDLADARDHLDNDNSRIVNIPHLEKETRVNEDPRSRVNDDAATNGVAASALVNNPDDPSDECKNGFNGFERIDPPPECSPESQLPGNANAVDAPTAKVSPSRETVGQELEIVCNGVEESSKAAKTLEAAETEATREEKPKLPSGRIGKRSARGFRGRPRLSVEERLIEDNRAYYKVEVLGNKLRSSTGPWSASATTTTTPTPNATEAAAATAAADEQPKKEGEPSSEKPVVVRFKRVRRSELSLLSDEAESFMFGEPKRDDGTSSEASGDDDNDQSSVLPRDTESEPNEAANLTANENYTGISSSIASSPIKQELVAEEESQDSVYMGRARKRRRTQAEMLLEENEEYYTFEQPGSRLRFQGQGEAAPVREQQRPEIARKTLQPMETRQQQQQHQHQQQEQRDSRRDDEKAAPNVGGGAETTTQDEPVLYPSKPSPEVEKMQFSFEAVPRSEPWYQTYQRQDEGAEFWHYFSEADERKPFLLPYEIENFHETLAKLFQKSDARKKNRRGPNGLGRSPRKSPRCHASTLAIMSTIIRKREQLQQQPNLSVVAEEESTPVSRCASRSQSNTPKPAANDAAKTPATQTEQQSSNTDGELRDMARCIDEMLSADGMLDADDSFEANLALQQQQQLQQQADDESIVEAPSIPRGPPQNLLELLDNCHDYFNCLENSSCASSECGEGAAESPHKRRKRRKNRTGWPGIKMRKKLQAKHQQPHQQQVEDVDSAAKKDNKSVAKVSSVTQDCVDRLRGNCGESVKREAEADAETRKIGGCVGGNEAEVSRTPEKCAPGVTTAISDCGQVFGDTGQHRRQNPRNIEENVSSPPVQCETITGSEETTALPLADESRKKTPKDSATAAAAGAEGSENSMTNDENHENHIAAASAAATTRQLNSKSLTRKRGRTNDSSSDATIDSRQEIENSDNLYIKAVNSAIISRKNYTTSGGGGTPTTKRRQTRESAPSESHDSEHSSSVVADQQLRGGGDVQQTRQITRKQRRTRRKRERRGNARSSLEFEDENCKNPTSIKSAKGAAGGASDAKRGAANEASESMDGSDLECGGLAERVSPSLMPTSEMQNRRSSIEFQPVVRMMKIDDQVDVDHSILSVTVASNRRLRSSSSPRSNVQPPAKRYKRSKGPFGRWIKNS